VVHLQLRQHVLEYQQEVDWKEYALQSQSMLDGSATP
jgi:hypothetical protein